MSQNEFPLVSVLLTAYNREKYIAEAIESVLDSTYKNFELIIVDDCSSDNTVQIARRYEKLDTRINIYVNERNLDQFPNRNKAATYAKGKYIKYLDSDDKIYDWGLQYCVELMEKYPQAGMGLFRAHNKVEEEYLDSKEAVRNHFFRNPFLNIGPSGIILKREAFDQAGYYSTDYGVPSDMYFNIKLASLFPVVILEKEFFFYRTHEGQEIRNEYSYLYNTYPYLRDLMAFHGIPLNKIEKNQLLTKAKRDFIIHCLKYVKKTRTITPAIKAFKHSRMGLKGFISGLFNK